MILRGSKVRNIIGVGILLAAAVFPLGVLHAASDPLLGQQKQRYSAVVRSDGKVMTYAKIIFSNSSKKDLRATKFTVPDGVNVTSLAVYQASLPEKCDKPQAKVEPKDNPQSTTGSNYSDFYECQRLEDDLFEKGSNSYYYDDYSYSYYSGAYRNRDIAYDKVSFAKSANTYTLKLPKSVKADSQGAYIVVYAVDSGYTSAQLGYYSLNFKTLQVPDPVSEARVSIDIASDFYMRDKKSTITESSTRLNGVALDTKMAVGASQSSELDRLQETIGTGGVLTKTGKQLLPNETFVVNGQFADAQWKLYIGEIAGGFGGVVIFGVITWFFFKKARQHEEERV